MRRAVTIAALSLAFAAVPGLPGLCTSAADDQPSDGTGEPGPDRDYTDYTMTDDLRELRRERYHLFTAIVAVEKALAEQQVVRSLVIPIGDEPLSTEQWEARKEQWRRLAEQNAQVRETRTLLRGRMRALRYELRIVERQIRLLEKRIQTAQSWGHPEP